MDWRIGQARAKEIQNEEKPQKQPNEHVKNEKFWPFSTIIISELNEKRRNSFTLHIQWMRFRVPCALNAIAYQNEWENWFLSVCRRRRRCMRAYLLCVCLMNHENTTNNQKYKSSTRMVHQSKCSKYERASVRECVTDGLHLSSKISDIFNASNSKKRSTTLTMKEIQRRNLRKYQCKCPNYMWNALWIHFFQSFVFLVSNCIVIWFHVVFRWSHLWKLYFLSLYLIHFGGNGCYCNEMHVSS